MEVQAPLEPVPPAEAAGPEQQPPPEDPDREELDGIAARRDEKLRRLRQLMDYVCSKRDEALARDREFEEAQIAAYTAKYRETGLPAVRSLMDTDEEFLRGNGLLTAGFAEERRGGPEIAAGAPPEPDALRGVAKRRTDTGLRYRWLPRPRDWRNVQSLLADSLDDSDEAAARVSAAGKVRGRLLEPLRAGARPVSPTIRDAERQALRDMNSRITYLRNPRHPLPAGKLYRLPEAYEPAARPKRGAGVRPASGPPAARRPKSLSRRRPAEERQRPSADAAAPRAAFSERRGDHEEEPSPIIAIPPAIHFRGYRPHRTYTARLELKNASKNSHRLRVTCGDMATASKHFAVEQIHTPQPEFGLVAPGMSCFYKITFTPDTLADYEDAFVVQAEHGKSFVVPAFARRDPPELSLPPALDCGPYQAGCTTESLWDVRNAGGPGRFLVLREDEVGEGGIDHRRIWSNVPDDLKARRVAIGPFEISPGYFSLDRGESLSLSVRYSPSPIAGGSFEREDQATFALACDNCQLLDVPVRGLAQIPRVELTAVAGNRAPEIREDAGEDGGGTRRQVAAVDFGPQNAHGCTVEEVTVRNLTRISLPFKWRTIDNPGDNRPRTARTVKGDPASPVVAEPEKGRTALWIRPNKGYIGPGADQTFTLSFTPKEMKSYDICADLYLLADNAAPRRPRAARKSGPGERDHSESRQASDEVWSLRLECTGFGVPYNIEVHPSFIRVPYGVPMGHTFEVAVRMTNMSISTIHYRTMVEDANPTVAVVSTEPGSGMMETGTCRYITVKFLALFAGKLDSRLLFVMDTGDVLRLPVQVEVIPRIGMVDVDRPVLDFGLFELGEARTLQMALTNKSPSGMKWEIRAFPQWPRRRGEGEVDGPDKELPVFEPCQGFLEGGAQETISAAFSPPRCDRFRSVMEIRVRRRAADDRAAGPGKFTADADSVAVSCVEMRAEVQTPLACLTESFARLPHSYVGIPAGATVTLRNLTLLPTTFRWQSVPTAQNARFDVQFAPAGGVLGPAEDMKIKIGLLPRAIGVFDDLLFACHIKGMAEGNGVIGLRVAVNVGGLEVVFDACPPARPTSPPLPDPAGASASRQGSGLRQPARLRTLAEVEGSIVRKVDQVDYTPSELTLDLGGTCPIFQRRSMTLVIHNLSAIAANFELGFANYPAPDQDGKGKASKGERGGRDAAAGLHRAPGETAFDGEANPAAVVEQSKDPPRLLPSSTTRAPKALLKPTSKDQQRFHSVTGQTYSTVVKESRHAGLLDQEMLQAGLGAALLAVPSRGRLEPRQSVQVQITSFNNLSGRYLDQLVVKVEHWLQRSIPVRMSVVGSPTRFVGRSIAADSADGSSLCRVNFGIRVVSNELGRLPLSAEVGGVVTKIAQVENQSPKAVVLDWRVYSVSSASASAGGGGGGGQQGDIVGRADVELGTILQRANSTGDGTPPFDISPRSILINAFQTQTMSISFGSPTPGIFNGAICAGVQVRERDGSAWPNAHEPATRPGSASIDKNLLALVPVILRVHGKSIAPHVTLDCGDRVRMKVRGRPDLPEAGAAPAPAPVVSRVINVSNTTDAEFGVELRCAAPFRAVFNLSPEQQRRRDRRAAGGGFHPGREVQHAPTEYSFMPKEETVMTVYFDHQAHLDALRGAARRPASPAAAPSQTPPPSAHGELTVVFSNGSTQVIPLAVELQSPGA